MRPAPKTPAVSKNIAKTTAMKRPAKKRRCQRTRPGMQKAESRLRKCPRTSAIREQAARPKAPSRAKSLQILPRQLTPGQEKQNRQRINNRDVELHCSG